MTQPLNAYQKAAAKAYCGGEFAHITRSHEASRVGDSLFAFIISELHDVDSFSEALTRLRNAAAELKGCETAIRIDMPREG